MNSRSGTGAVCLVLLAGACASAPPPRQGTMQHRDTLRDAVTAPLEDVNLKQVEIPDALRRAVADPYDMRGLNRCEPLAAEIGRLDAALGPDLDEAPPPDGRTLTQKGSDAAYGYAVGTVRDKTEGAVPFRSWVRRLSGAEAHQKHVQAAIKAGGIRRGYLKGAGMRMNCAPPAAPSWFRPAPPPKPKAPPQPEALILKPSWWPF
jgi:hypothetical protein